MEKKARVLMLDESRVLSDAVRTFFMMSKDLNLCGVCHDGCTGYEQIVRLKPEILVLDVVLPLMDGITVLKLLKKEHPDYHPLIIVTSLLRWEQLAPPLLKLGTQYFLEKPYDLSVLVDRIHMLLENRDLSDDTVAIVQSRSRLLQRIWELERQIGIMDKMIGFRYIAEAVLMILRRAPETVMVTKDIYPDLARTFHVTPATIEGAVRRSIRTSYRDHPAEFLKFFPNCSENKLPSNAVFLCRLAALTQQMEAGGEA